MPYSHRDVALQIFETDLEFKLEELAALRQRTDDDAKLELTKIERDIAELKNEIQTMRSEIAKAN